MEKSGNQFKNYILIQLAANAPQNNGQQWWTTVIVR